MESPVIEQPRVETQKPKLEATGIRILGDVDPRTLSKEAFEASPDLLFHGASKPFNYSPKYDYSSPEYFTDADGSQTIGEGFYTTDGLDVAENYSRVRQNKDDSDAVVLALLPYQARILDLRASNDNSRNAPIPNDIFEKWFQFYKAYYFNQEARQNQPWDIANIERDYFQFLVRAKKLVEDEPIDLRVMLDTSPHPKLGGHNNPHPPYVKLFANFMRQEEIDGIVYIEGGEGANAKSHPSYIFYNLEKVGTHDSWKSSQTPPPQT